MQDDKKAVTIRQPATANLMVDTADRDSNVYPSPFDFQINKANSIMNGFFSRIGTTEVVLEWNEPNGSYLTNVSTTFFGTGGVISTVVTPFNQLAYYNVEEAIGAITSSISSGTGHIIYGTDSNGAKGLVDLNGNNFGFQSPLDTLNKLCLTTPGTDAPSHPIVNPDLRPYRYLDFVSNQLTYNQDLKDNATNTNNKDVLCRWYMAWDSQPKLDGLGFPVEMGYEPFKLRRLFNPPKQIKWDPTMPIGQLSFQVYGDNGNVPVSANQDCPSDWLMTLQLNE